MVAAGLRGWDQASEPVALRAWTRMCSGQARLPARPADYRDVFQRISDPRVVE